MSMTTFETLKLLFMLLILIQIQKSKAETKERNLNLKTREEHNEKSTTVLTKSEDHFPKEIINQTHNAFTTNTEPGLVYQTLEKKIYNKFNNSVINNSIKYQVLMKRLKRQHSSSLLSASAAASSSSASSLSTFDLSSLNNHISLPSVPIPPPPPFPNNFAITPFGSSASANGLSSSSSSSSKSINAFAFSNQHQHHTSPSSSLATHKCGGILKARHGVIQTPNFPHKFATPIECVWIIDASELIQHSGHNISIVVYLTQLYVLGGLKFTEYMYYSDDYKVPAHRVFTLTEDDVTQVAWIQFNSQYLEIRFRMSSLDGTHLRALDRLLDVYGFNMTYEVEPVKSYQCNTLQCRFLGHCYAKEDFSSYYCSCFPGFSGMDCGRGPLCEDPHTNICQNGGTCKHIGDAAITCHCPVGFKGTKCEIPDINETTMGCITNSSALDCHRECDFENSKDGGISLLKSSRTSARSGKTRYEVTIRLGANLTAFYRHIDGEQRAKEQIPTFLEKHLMRVLRNFNITKVSDLELISNTTDRLDITFHFFGIKGDSNRIREAITRMVERGRIGNITLVSNYHLFDENPPLNLMDLTVNQKQIIREDSEFILSCTAQGSARMQFQWYKDGIVVNASKATREIWTTVLPPETKDIFTAILGISKANRLDEGIYTCKVTDWGVEQCRSLHVHIKSPPRLRVDPASVTLHKGDSLRVRCLSPGNDDIKRYAQLGYSWTRNGILFQSDPKTVMWEDLYPDGSILKINNIQKSAEYSCVVSNTVKPVSKSVYITVIDRNAVHVCHAESAFGVHWPTSAPGGVAVISDCPRGFEGFSKRTCEKRDVGNSTWLMPDFSNCIRDQLLRIYDKFRALIAGFQQTNTSELLKACLDYTLKRYKHFLPGEAGFLIDMLHELDNYLQLKGTQLEREMAAEIILHILDKVMQNIQSLNSQQQIKKLQLLTQSAALNRETIAASQLATSTSTGSITQAQASSSSSSSTLQHTSSSSSSSSSITSLTQSTLEDRHAASSSPSSSSSLSIANGNNRQTLLKTDILHSPNSGSHTSNNGVSGSGMSVDGSSTSSVAGGSHSILTVDEDSLSLDRLNSLRIYMTSIKTLPFNLRIYGDDLFSDQLYMDIGLSNRLLNIMANNTIFASVISYKNLKSFLPKTYYTRGSDPKESDYILASRIIQTWLFQSNRSNDNMREPLDLPFEHGHVEIIFQHERAPKDSDWIAVCGHDYKASFESSWRSDLCITKNLMENITRCICPVSGTYVVMLTKRNNHSHHLSVPPRPIFVIISCVCCLLQSCSAFIILLPIWYNRQCAITFLKMQFCVSTSSIMVIFLLGFLKMLPVNWQPIISSSLASLLLLGISTLIAIALVIHSELVPKKLLHVNNKSTNATNSTISTAAATANNTTTINTAATTMTAITSSQQTTLATLTKNQQEQELEKATAAAASSGNTTITQISATPTQTLLPGEGLQTLRRPATPATPASLKPPLRFVTQATSTSGVRGAIGISWLLPLLFAITSPLICTINGKWPQNWWLEIMSHNMATTTTSTSTATTSSLMATTSSYRRELTNTAAAAAGADNFMPLNERYFRTHLTPFTTSTEAPLLSNGDSFLEFNTTSSLDNTQTLFQTTTTTTSSGGGSHSQSATMWSTSIQTAARSPVTSISLLHNEDIFSTGSADAGVTTEDGLYSYGPAPAQPALNFILFLCVDILFILLFFALFAILIKKLLWLWHKNRRTNNITTNTTNTIQQQQQQHHSQQQQQHQQHPPHQSYNNASLDKFNMVMKQRIGLLYRTGCLLLIKLCTDALFIVYSNAIAMETWWCYPFGISCILMGFTILFCFILKPECSLRLRKGNSNNFSSSDTLKKKLSSSKTSLDENYCTGSINTPISFYTNHEKESESCSAPPLMHKAPPSPARQHLEMSATTCQMPGLTIISTAPRCQMLPLLATTSQQDHVASVETFIGAAAAAAAGNNSTLERKSVAHMACMQQHTNSSATASITSPATRCCNILGGGGSSGGVGGGGSGGIMSHQPQHQLTGMPQVVSGSSVGYYDAYAAATMSMQHQQQHPPNSMNMNMTGSLSRRATHLATTHQQQQQLQQQLQQQQQHQHLQQQPLTHEYVGVETLDILQGVAPDTIIGIRSPVNPVSICPSIASYHHPPPGVHYTNAAGANTYINATPQLIPSGAIVSISGLTSGATATGTINYTIPATIITTTSVTTQTPKTQKRVTIMEPTTNHTFDPLLPTMVALAGANTSTSNIQQQQQQQQQLLAPTPIITISNTSNSTLQEDKSNNKNEVESPDSEDSPEEDSGGMLDRITHDLNYLLNGADDSDQIPPPPRPPTGSIPTTDMGPAEVTFQTDKL